MTYNQPLGDLVDRHIQRLAALQESDPAAVPAGRRWEQGDYRCNTGMCVAGWTRELADDGTEWAQPKPGAWGGDVILLPEDVDSMPYSEEVIEDLKALSERKSSYVSRSYLPVEIADDRLLISAEDYGKAVLGLVQGDAWTLFEGSNDAEAIEQHFEDLRNGVALQDRASYDDDSYEDEDDGTS